MKVVLFFHIIAGLLGLVSGYIALYSAKGATLHRRSGMLFVYVMLPMAMTGMFISAVSGVAPAINIPAAALTFYMVTTSLATVRSISGRWSWFNRAAMLFALLLGVVSIALTFVVIARGGRGAGMAYPLFIFGVIALSASAGDRRMIRAGGVSGSTRLRRHLWRMCFALFIAAGSFFLGQADEFPAALRIRPLLAVPVLAVLATMTYWLWRVRVRAPRQSADNAVSRSTVFATPDGLGHRA
jgi:uncharacterized membrane protein